ncbi:MAG TPA: glycoside hydrolase family 9 protein [Balneolales bacterium]|nr:glycoside hydrolase family 9 protein [Balneolales bacterium]
MYRKYVLGVISMMALIFAGRVYGQDNQPLSHLQINDKGYYEMQGLDVMVFDDFYPEGHQGGLTIVQFGTRVAANGDVRLEPTPGQWSPVPKVGKRTVDKDAGVITVSLSYPDSSKDRKGFNPIDYPDLRFHYTIRTETVGNSIKLTVDLDKPLPAKWAGKVGFNLELFPGRYFGEHYLMDGKSGIFPRQANGPMEKDSDGKVQIVPMSIGKKLVVSPDNERKQITFVSEKSPLQLIDGRGLYNNGWFVLRSTIPAGAVKKAVEWMITPKTDTGWRYKPVIQVSQVGYHPKQAKFAVIELDKLTQRFRPIQLIKIGENSEQVVKTLQNPVSWGKFLRYKYLRFDFSDVTDPGIYKIKYGDVESSEFEIKDNIFARNVWQPTLEYFLPVQMCHMKVEDRYRVWHGLCHMDDATMAPVNKDHFDGYSQGPSTLTKYKSGQHVPGLNIGGWHDAGDYDLRIESQAGTVYDLALAYEFFKNNYDATSINETKRLTEMHVPDGKPDIIQQMEHGLLTIVGGYEALGRLYRGIQEATLHQYTLLGEAANATDNIVYKPGATDPVLHRPLPKDDRMVFTGKNPQRELYVAQVLAASGRVLQKFNPALASKCVQIAEEIYKKDADAKPEYKINAAGELYLTTSKDEYKQVLLDNAELISDHLMDYAMTIGRVVRKINNPVFTRKIEKAVKEASEKIAGQAKQNPYGVPYRPYIWGDGWNIQELGVRELLLHMGFPDIFPTRYAFNALNFVLGCHPGKNTASFVSGVGVKSLTVAYGFNRADWTYIPGGVGSGTALIRPDLPELKKWPYFWQQTEYVMGGGGTNFMFLAMAADYLYNGK